MANVEKIKNIGNKPFILNDIILNPGSIIFVSEEFFKNSNIQAAISTKDLKIITDEIEKEKIKKEKIKKEIEKKKAKKRAMIIKKKKQIEIEKNIKNKFRLIRFN